MSDEGKLVADRYRITQRIGTGAMGAVWQGQDELLGRTVAIKQLLLQPGLDETEAEEARERTMREGRIAARLHHANAITVFDAVTDDNGQPCLIMEYLQSTSLAAVLKSKGPLPPVEVARIGQQVAAALVNAHRVNVVHRDIKPGNILLADDGAVKITDFGISRAKDDVSITKTGLIAGTPAFLAPEVAIGNNPGPESDVFSLGSTLYAATEGQPPFGLSENTLGLLHAVAAGHINPPQQSGPLTSVLARLLHPEKHERPTAEQAERLLAAVARGETPLGGPADTAVAAGGAAAASGAAGSSPSPGTTPGEEQPTLAAHSGTLSGTAGSDPQPTLAAVDATEHGTPDETDHPDDPDGPEQSRGLWKPAAIGGVVLAALAAGGIWMFTGADQDSNENPVNPPATVSSESPTSTSAPTTSEQEPQPEPQPEPNPAPERQPEPEQGPDTESQPDPTTPPETSPTSEPTQTEPTAGEPTAGDPTEGGGGEPGDGTGDSGGSNGDGSGSDGGSGGSDEGSSPDEQAAQGQS